MKVLSSIKKNTYLILIITILVLYLVLKDDFEDIVEAFQNINGFWLIIAILFLFLSIGIKGLANYIVLDDKRLTIKEAIKHNVIVQFFNGVTPFCTGGQPMEIYMATEHKIPLSKATNRTIQSFIYYQIALVLCGIIAVMYNFFHPLFPKIKILDNLVLIGFIINFVVAIIFILISKYKKITTLICNLTKKIAKKLKWNMTEEVIEEKFEEYYRGFQEIRNKKFRIFLAIFLNVLSLICLYLIPLFILESMQSPYRLTIINTLTTSAYVYIMGAFIPIPGASGGIEYGFTQFFSNFIGVDKIAAVLLLWRSITYYFPIIVGALVFNLERKVKR